MKKELCSQCGKHEIAIKKRRLCRNCYARLHRNGQLDGCGGTNTGVNVTSPRFRREVDFAVSFFDSTEDYLYEPSVFFVPEHGRYTPDFFDKRRGVFIEVVGSKQALSANRKKMEAFVEHYGNGILFEVRNTQGEMIKLEARKYIKKSS